MFAAGSALSAALALLATAAGVCMSQAGWLLLANSWGLQVWAGDSSRSSAEAWCAQPWLCVCSRGADVKLQLVTGWYPMVVGGSEVQASIHTKVGQCIATLVSV